MPGTRWLTFDCYGTIADWNACMLAALEPVAGPRAGGLLAAYHRAESMLEAMPAWRPYREVLTGGLALAARRTGIGVTPQQAGALVAAWPSMPLFDDVAEALTALVSAGWRLAILTNCDEDLFAFTAARLPVRFDVVVTAEQVRSYKPDLGHFRRFADLTGATQANWIHVANSWVHDMLPAARMGLRSVWVDRDHSGHPAKFAERRVTSMRRLPETVTDVSALPAWPAPLPPLAVSRAGGRASDNGSMATTADLLTDGFGRIRENVDDVLDGLTPEQLSLRLDAEANPVSWLVWHLTRVQDDHVADAFGVSQVWSADGWARRFGLPAGTVDDGYGHSSEQVAEFAAATASATLLREYHEAVHAQTVKLVSEITDAELDRIVDKRWTPHVTLGVRLVSVIDDDMQHVGQAAFVRGIAARR